MERSSRKILVGTIVSTKNQKTVIVAVDTYKKHPLYGKRFKSTKRFAAHVEDLKTHVGDLVQIVETRPYSKTKHFRLAKVISTKKEGE